MALLTALSGACSINSRSAGPAHGEPRTESQRTAKHEPSKAPLPGPAQPSSTRIPVTQADGVWGSPLAPVTLVVFTDLECPYCARAESSIEVLRRRYGAEKLRVVVKHFPFHEHSELAARYAQATLLLGGGESFFRFLSLAFAGQGLLGNESALGRFAEQAGVSASEAFKVARDGRVTDKLAADQQLLQGLGVNATPTFFVNGALLVGALPLDEFARIIDGELAAAAELLSGGMAPELVYTTRVEASATVALREQAAQALREEQDAEAEHDGVIWKVPIDGTPLKGPKNALVTIVEFSDFECPYCRRADETIERLYELYPGKLRLSRRENPLPFHERALPAAHFALEARAQKGDAAYFAASHKLFLSGLEPEHLDDIASELGLDVARMRRALSSQAHKKVIERDQDLAFALEARGTPHFFINGWRLGGAQPLSRFRAVVDAQLKVAESLVAGGVPAERLYDELMKRGRGPEPPERWSLPPPPLDLPARGPRGAPVVIEVFTDLECGFCARAERTLRELEPAFPGKLRIVYRHLPLESLHPHARAAARAVIEARLQAGDAAFFKLLELFYAEQNEEGAFGEARLRDYAKRLGLDAQRLLDATRDTRHDAVIDRDRALAGAAGIEATPSFSINGYRLSGAQPIVAFRRLIRHALAERPRKHP